MSWQTSALARACARALYSALMTLGQPLLRRKLARRGRQEPGYLEAVEERFGHYRQPVETAKTPESAAELVWIHAVSLGETRTAAVLLKALRAEYPTLRLLLTHGTATGRAEGRALLQALGDVAGGDVQVWQPWDSPAAAQRFLAHFKPRLGLLMETEVWPNLVAAAAARAMPLLLVNGRMSEKSLKQALRLAPLALPAYGALSAVYAQTQADAGRFRQLGAPVLGVFGNLKFDATPSAAQRAQGQRWRESLKWPVLLFASAREGEEDEFFTQIKKIKEAKKIQEIQKIKAKALIVPRHPQRFDEVAALAVQHGLCVSRRSDWPDAGPAASEEAMNADLWLGDSLGEMALYYALSGAALLGGSFAPLGGQNLIEAAACACPVLMGPHTFNFAEAAVLAESAGAAQRVADMAQAVQAALALLENPPAQAQAAAAGLAFAASHQGAARRTLAALRAYLN